MKHLIFDIGGVLLYPRLGDWNIPFRAADILGNRAQDLFSARYISAAREAGVWLDESRRVSDIALERQLRRKYIETLNLQMKWWLTPREMDLLADDFTDNLDRYAFFEDVLPYMTRWKADYTLSVLSDAMPSIFRFLEHAGVSPLLNAAVISTQVGALKPSPDMYRAVLTALKARPEDCLFVDDRPCNVEGALRMGMHAVQMARNEFPPAHLWSGPVVRSFEMLNQMLLDGEIF